MKISHSSLVAIAGQLEMLIQEAVPECTSLGKYGGTLFTLKPNEKEGQFCGVFIFKQHVQVSFSKGIELTDSKKLLKGSGKFRRHLNFCSIDEIEPKYLKTLVIQSSKL